LQLVDGQPLTHDILSALNVLDPDSGSASETEVFDAASDNSIGANPFNQDHTFAEWPTLDGTETEPTPPLRKASDINTISSCESSASEPMDTIPSSSHDSRWPSFETSLAEPRSQTRMSSTANPELTHSPIDQNKHCFRTLDDPMFATLNHQQTYPVFRTMDDPMFATLVDGPWEYPSSLVRVNAGFAVA
jgi:hypothetical protein